ncbi:uncharacterized protein LOC118182165 [Stegodyphus dumicola]|uniref:uncharacterized protein LOC118182165 n=1 Tax=Stegodyphus dumicola TaxID=202533 RepID=UPI0015A7CF57|nr:uncharacterized protein LOC118182165 [Stegodyphus dumicola]
MVLKLFRYIYGDENPTEVTADLLVAAERYCLPHLREHLQVQLLPNLTVVQACDIVEGLEYRQQNDENCPVKMACWAKMEKHALRIFVTDLVLHLSRSTLIRLLESDDLNIPDEAYVFWGVWRWGRKLCCKSNRPLTEESVASFLDDLLVLMRCSSLRRRNGIPEVALKRFSRCLCRRSRYSPPEDSLEQCTSFRTCGHWEDVIQPKSGEKGTLCLQMSFDREVMLVGITLEICATGMSESFIRIFKETDGSEILRQRICWNRCTQRKLSTSGEYESWHESDLILHETLFLAPSEIYSVYLYGCTDPFNMPCVSVTNRRRRVAQAFATLHGQMIMAVRELHIVPDAKATWGPRCC